MKTIVTNLLAILWIAGLLTVPSNLLAGSAKHNAPRSANVADGIDLSKVDRSGSRVNQFTPDGPSAVLTVPVPYATITAAIAAANSGDIIQIAAGTYVENVVVNKSVEIAGAGAASTIIRPQVSGPNPGGGGSLPPGSSNMMLVQANNVTIHDLTLDGDNPALTSGIVVGGADLDARNGIITNHALGVYNNLIVYNVTVKNIYLRGMYASSGGTFNFHNNTVQNVQAEYASIALFNFGGSGVFANNTVSGANDAISANWSTGTQFLNNIITNSGSGIHTDNNGGSGGVADLIQGNSVSNSAANGYGVWVFFPYLNTTLNNNTITNCDVALFAWGGAGGVGSFTNNIVNGQNRAGSAGAYATVGLDAWISYQSNVSASFTGNTVQNTSYGFLVETDEATPFYTLNLTVAGHTISGNTTDIYVSGLGAITISGLGGNTVLVSSPARVQDGISLANVNGTVTLSAGTFEEQPEIAKSLTLQGTSVASTTIKAPVTLTKHYNVAGGPENYPVLYVHDAGAVTVKDMTVDGFGRGNGNYRFQGVAFRNAGGMISNCTIKDVRETPINGNQHGVALYAYADNGTARALNVVGSTIVGFQKNGTAFGGANLTVVFDGNTVTGAGAISFTAQNGVQLAYGAAGSIINNTMTGFSYTPGTTLACAMLLYQPSGPITTSNNVISASQMGVYYYNVGGTISGNTLSATAASVGQNNYWGINADPGAVSRLRVDPFDASVMLKSAGGMLDNPNSITTTIYRNTLTSDGTHGTAIEMDALGIETLNGAATENIVHGWDAGVVFYKDAGATLNGVANNNDLSGNTYAVYDLSGVVQDASGNWFGSNDPGVIVSKLSTDIDYTPWLDSGTDTSPATAGFQGDFSKLWVSSSSPQAGSTGRIQEGVNLATGSTVNVLGGTYTESVNANKANLNLLGEGASTTTINPGSSSLNCITMAANGMTISGFTLTGGQNGLSGTTASTKIKNCIVSANSQNGIRLVDADFNVLQGNTISGHTSGVGVLLLGSKQNSISGNTIQNNNYNVLIDINGTRTARGNIIQGNNLFSPGTWSVNVNNEPKTTNVNFNVFSPADKYVRNSTAVVTQKVDATYNWFGGESTPLASHFSGAVDYSNNYATNPTVSVLPASYYLPTGSTATLNVMALLPAGVYVRGIDATLSWSNDAQVPDIGDPVEGSFFSSFASRLYAFDRPTTSSLRVNEAILGPTTGAGNPPAGLPYVGTLFSQDFQAAAEGSSTLTLSGVQLRDPNNVAITPLVIDPPGGAQLVSDGTAPSVASVFIDNTSIDNDNFIKNTDNATLTATVTDASPLTLADITADLSPFYGGVGHTADSPSSYAANIATWTVAGATCSPADGAISIIVSSTDLAGNTGTGSDNITADNTLPTAPTTFVAKTVSPGGHQNVALSWAAGTDANYRGVEVRYNGWSYPTYPTGSTPTYPATHSAGTGVSATPITGTNTTHAIVPRNINYYSVFAVDWAGNYSALDPSGTDRAANYYLGDLGSGTETYVPGTGGYNGQVNYEDLFWFSRLYFTSSPGWTSLDPNAAEGDFGPTAANKTYPGGNRFGIPLPDGRIDFEDLMIFSMNYYNVVPKVQPPENIVVADELSLGLEGNNRTVAVGDQFVVTLDLANDGRPVKGTSVSIKFNPALLQVIGVESGALMGNNGQSFFAHKEEGNIIQIDQALLGVDRTVEYSGTLALIHFRALQSGEARVTLESGIVRDGENSSITPLLHNEVVALPATFALAQNYPNPFNPTTMIKYQVPSAVHVELTVFNVIGEKVATLVNGVQEAGYYNISWNATSTHSVASGIYFYVLRAGEFTSIKKMMLVK